MRIADDKGDIFLQRVIYSLILVCTLAVLSACGGKDYRAPVEDRQARQQAAPGTYSVKRGDTLYSIAFRYGLDFRDLARRNSISSPYTIYPGQRLYVAQSPPARSAPTTKPAPVPASRPAPKPAPTPVTTKPMPATTPRPTGQPTAPVRAWRWPTTGAVVRGYSSTVHKGIDIAGRKGDPIYAVAAGKVVYSGTGIVGFGELLIIKHNEIYLSAYGHNDALLVGEGDTVKAGQKIATKGSSGTDTVKLHFEIRKEGKPIDPRKLLPSR